MTYIPAALRRLVHERAGGACEDCLAPEATAIFAHEVDHVVDARIVAQTAAARATVRLLQLNWPERVAERAVLVAAALLRPPG